MNEQETPAAPQDGDGPPLSVVLCRENTIAFRLGAVLANAALVLLAIYSPLLYRPHDLNTTIEGAVLGAAIAAAWIHSRYTEVG